MSRVLFNANCVRVFPCRRLHFWQQLSPACHTVPREAHKGSKCSEPPSKNFGNLEGWTFHFKNLCNTGLHCTGLRINLKAIADKAGSTLFSPKHFSFLKIDLLMQV